ncbi:putative beta-galactosidase [Penicillium oxalicum 114-2]|uniref:Putative beta-galactosidase n=1 Tax=Penicillium oxalicum (strain 114-2 / CGMCC 5302) TaxID=933388 RepID=S8BF30_PENO1|nr:putative beta-galactosidase [Penicillium oxalicum 114-2]
MATSYPRPDFQRKTLNWVSLDGTWSFTFDDDNIGLALKWHSQGIPCNTADKQCKREINVPYAFQTPASGIGLLEAHELMWYERRLDDIRTEREKDQGNRLLLRFGAVDYECSVWVNGHFIGEHRGGHVPFDLDVTDSFRADSKSARLTVRVRDSPYDLAQPRGKQYWKPVSESIFYTPTGGIWQSVWIESVPPMRLCCGSGGTVLRSDDIEHGQLHARIAVTGRSPQTPCSVQIEAILNGVTVGTKEAEFPRERDLVALDLDVRVPDDSELKQTMRYNDEEAWHKGVALWAPEHPALYDIAMRLHDGSGSLVDEVYTTVGMRSLSWQSGDGTFRLNGRPLFQALTLDQGYWPETGMTPPSSEALRADIEMAKKLGFNGCRKHQKVEDPRFLYWADRLGYLVWGEMANAYEFGSDYTARMNAEWTEAVKRDINHPCVITWTPNNESWAYTSLKDNIEQRNHIRSLYYMTKTLDPSRPINDNCGWEHVLTDLTTYHDYADAPELAQMCSKMEGGILGPKAGREMFVRPIFSEFPGHTLVEVGAQHQAGAPVLCTEFGGVNIAPAKHSETRERDWGYTTATDVDDFLWRFENLVMAVVKGGHTCGLVYTQLYDIEQEVNGLLTYDRQAKVPVARVKAVLDAAQDLYYRRQGTQTPRRVGKILHALHLPGRA